MLLDAVGKAMIAQQVKHHYDGLDADHQYKVHSWVPFLMTLVGLRWMPDEDLEASK